MSHKKAKRIRREINYNPSKDTDREYVQVNQRGTLEVSPKSKRSLYQEMKKEV